jgi:hypothetical protein
MSVIPLSQFPRRTLQLAFAFLLAAGSAGSVVPQAAAASPAAREAAISSWDDAAAARGAVGTYFDDATGELVALLPASSGGSVSAADSASVRADASAVGLLARVELATIDKGTIDAIQTALLALRPSIPLTYGYAFYFDPRRQKVVLETEAPASAFASVSAKYGNYLQYDGGGFVTLSRQADYAPHFGGSDIFGPNQEGPGNNGCTTGFSVLYHGTPYMLTAGHCFTQGSALYNFHCLDNTCTSRSGSGSYMGYVSWQGGPNRDSELFYGSSYGGYIYTSATASKKVAGAGDPAVNGSGYCVSGAYGGTWCSHTDITNTASACESGTGWCLSNLSFFQGGTLPTSGDSGSPLYLDAGSEVAIRGSVIGLGAGGFYAEDWSQISGYFGVSILNG